MNKRTSLLILLLVFVSSIFAGGLTIRWGEGRDNLYKHPASFVVTNTQTKRPVGGATFIVNGKKMGVTDKQGRFWSKEINAASVKYTIEAQADALSSGDTTYHVRRSAHPFPTFVNPTRDAATGVSFAWQTNVSTKTSKVEWVERSDPKGFASKETKRTEGKNNAYQLTDVDGEKGKPYTVNVHKASISGLTPATEYAYRVGDGKNWAEGTFMTAPETGSKEKVKFLFFADTQESSRENYQGYFRKVAEKAFALNPDIRLALHAGDITNRGKNGQEWEWFFESAEQQFRNVLFAPNVGNHEVGGIDKSTDQNRNEYFLQNFNNPSNGTKVYAEGSTYSFDYGMVHLVCIDNQSLIFAMEKAAKGDSKALDAAKKWLEEDLINTTATWKVVTMHQPIFGANRDEKELRKVLAPIIDKCKVNLVICGHDHYYFRSFPMRYNPERNDGDLVPINEFGTTHIIAGSTCRKMYVQKYARPYQAVVLAQNLFEGRYPYLRTEILNKQNYSVVSATTDKLLFQFFDMDGKQLDEVTLTR